MLKDLNGLRNNYKKRKPINLKFLQIICIHNLNLIKNILLSKSLTSSQLNKLGVNVSQDGSIKTAYQILGLPNFGVKKMMEIFPEFKDFNIKALNYYYI